MPYTEAHKAWVHTEEEWIEEQALQELHSACEANDSAPVRTLYSKPPYSTVFDQCIKDSTPNTALLRCVLEDGASPESYDAERYTNSKDTLELMAEFGYNIKLQGQLL